MSYQRLRAASEVSVAGPSYWIHSLMTDLKTALDENKLQTIKGIGQKTLDTMRQYVTEQEQRN